MHKPEDRTIQKIQFLINNLHREMDGLKEDTTNTAIHQNGKIADLYNYLKENLSNATLDLLEQMQVTGELDRLITDAILNEIEVLRVKVSPKQFGAVGDGITDDTYSLQLMIKEIESILPTKEFENETPCKDYSGITFEFSGKYLISKPLVFENTYGLCLDNLQLVAAENFHGDEMLRLNKITRDFNATNLYIDGSHIADRCLWIHDYTLSVNLVNTTLKGFKMFGLYADGKGHEIKATNLKISQFEWGEKDSSDLTTGIGIYLGSDRHDNKFVNTVVNYCKTYGIQLLGGATNFVNSHFYSCKVRNEGRYNLYSECYFDNASFETRGFFTLTNSLLLKSEGDTTPFIYLLEGNDANNWYYDTSIMNGNTFKAVDTVKNAIDLGEYMTKLPKFTTVGNTFYYVTPFTAHGRMGHTRNPWDEERESFGDETSGYKIYGNLAIVWGHATENGFQTYPNGLELSQMIHFGYERKDNSNPNLIPWINSVKSNQFWLNSVGTGSTVKWIVIGVVK